MSGWVVARTQNVPRVAKGCSNDRFRLTDRAQGISLESTFLLQASFQMKVTEDEGPHVFSGAPL